MSTQKKPTAMTGNPVELLEKASMLLFEASDIIDELCAADFVKCDTVWDGKMFDMSTKTCCFASDLAELYGMTYICNKRERSNA